MKTRIKVTTTKDENKTYSIQKKGRGDDDFSWLIYLIPILGWIVFIEVELCWNNIYDQWNGTNNYSTLDYAKQAIDKYLQNIISENIKEKNSKIIKIDYIKHP
jgi:hypothetical protein